MLITDICYRPLAVFFHMKMSLISQFKVCTCVTLLTARHSISLLFSIYEVSWFFNFFGCNYFLYFLNFLCCTDCGKLGTIYISCFISVFFGDFLCTYNRILKNLEKYIGAMTTDQHFVGNRDRFIADICTSFSIDYFICSIILFYLFRFCIFAAWKAENNWIICSQQMMIMLFYQRNEIIKNAAQGLNWFQICKSKVSLGPKRLLSL